jgi:hypothetical protein
MEEDSPSNNSQDRHLENKPLTKDNKSNTMNMLTITKDSTTVFLDNNYTTQKQVLNNRVNDQPDKAPDPRRLVRGQVEAIEQNLLNNKNTRARNRTVKEVTTTNNTGSQEQETSSIASKHDATLMGEDTQRNMRWEEGIQSASAAETPPITVRERASALQFRIESMNINDTPVGLETKDTSQQTIHFSKSVQVNDRWGDDISMQKDGTFRIYFQNVNSLALPKTEKWINVLNAITNNNCDIIGLAETCADWKNKTLQHSVRQIARAMAKHTTIAFSDNRTVCDTTYLPGGTLQMATGRWCCRYQRSLNDEGKKGRWSGQQFTLQANKSLYCVTAYRPCIQSQATSTPRTATNQQIIISREEGVECPNPRNEFVTDLIQQYKKWGVTPEDYFVLMIDANETLGRRNNGIGRLVEQLRLVDVFSRQQGQICNVATHARGKNRIDYILTSRNMLPYVRQSGYLPFYSVIPSDHRGAYIDIDESIATGNATPADQTKRQIGTKSRLKELLRYKAYLHKQFDQHRLYDKAKALYDEADKEETRGNDFLERLNELDSLITQHCLAAEKVVKPKIKLSPESFHAHQVVHYWNLRAKAKLNRIDTTIQQQELKDRLPPDWQSYIDNNKRKTKAAVRHAKMVYTTIKKQEREAYQEDIMEEMKAVAACEGSTAEMLMQLRTGRAEVRKTFSQLKVQLKSSRSNGITYIEVPDLDADGNSTDNPDRAATWRKVTDPVEMEDILLERNMSHFGQAQGTPFTVAPIVDAIGYDGEGSLEEMIKQSDDTDGGLNTLIKKLTDGNQLLGIDDDLSINDFTDGFKKWSEDTTTSPSGRHLGHYKCLLVPDGTPKPADGSPTVGESIMQVHFHLAMAAVRAGVSLTRWQHSTTAMIEKTPGIPRINKLRVIHLYEADYNLVLKLLWARKLVWNAHVAKRLNEGQAGSRPGRQCVDVVIHKEMKYLYARLTRTGMATMDNDAKSCYDRIICNLAMMVSKYFGMTGRACKTHAATLQHMRFRLRTALGDSERFYHHTEATPIHGSGQGSCASPCLWLLISSILMDCLVDIGNGMTMADVKTLETIQQWIEGFVDDTSLFANTVPFTDSLPDLKTNLATDMQLWASLLEATGGKLELSKCFYYIMSWKFDHNGKPIPMNIREQSESISPITVKASKSAKVIEIRQLEVETSHRTLGVWKTMVGDESDHRRVMQGRSDHMGALIGTAHMTRHQARVAYNSIYTPMMNYSLPACSLKETELDNLQTHAVSKFLPAMGYDRSFPRAAVFGPREYGGLNLNNLYTEQCMQKLQCMLCHLRSNTPMGRLMKINLNWIQLNSGFGVPLMESNDPLTFMDNNWLLHSRNFLVKINAKMKVQDTWVPQLERENDRTLMDIFRKLNFQPNLVRKLNYWRLYYQVNTVADICMADGRTVRTCYRTQPFRKEWHRSRKSKLNWPIQEEPGDAGFKQWTKSLREGLGMQNGVISKEFWLGKWIVDNNISESEWDHYYDPTTEHLFVKTDEGYTKHAKTKDGRRIISYNFTSIATVAAVPTEANPVDVRRDGNTYIATGFCASIHKQHDREETTFTKYLESQEEWIQQLLFQWLAVASEEEIEEKLQSASEITLVSDGGFNQGKGSFGCVIECGGMELLTVAGKVPGKDELNSSFRCEAYGMLAGLCLLKYTQLYLKNEPHHDRRLEVFCDNMGLIQRMNKSMESPMVLGAYNSPDIDVELQLLSEIKYLTNQEYIVTMKHVKGHQDAIIPINQLSKEARLNVRADHLAKDALKSHVHGIYCELPANPVSLWIDNQPITSRVKTCVRTAHLSKPLLEHLMKKLAVNQQTLDCIWWTVHGNALKVLPSRDRMRIQKFIHKRWATNHREAKYYSHRKPACSVCDNQDEDEDHILRCPADSREKIRQDLRDQLHEFLKQPHTPDAIRIPVISGILAWLHHKEIPTLDRESSADLIKAYKVQGDIGWGQAMRGRIAVQWRTLIQHHLDTLNKLDHPYKNSVKTMTAERWGTKLISILYDFVLRLWDQRNIEEHGETTEGQTATTKKKLILEVKQLQEQGTVLHNDRDWLYVSDNYFDQLSVLSIRAWIRNVRILMNIYRNTVAVSNSRLRLPYDRGPYIRVQQQNSLIAQSGERRNRVHFQ